MATDWLKISGHQKICPYFIIFLWSLLTQIWDIVQCKTTCSTASTTSRVRSVVTFGVMLIVFEHFWMQRGHPKAHWKWESRQSDFKKINMVWCHIFWTPASLVKCWGWQSGAYRNHMKSPWTMLVQPVWHSLECTTHQQHAFDFNRWWKYVKILYKHESIRDELRTPNRHACVIRLWFEAVDVRIVDVRNPPPVSNLFYLLHHRYFG